MTTCHFALCVEWVPFTTSLDIGFFTYFKMQYQVIFKSFFQLGIKLMLAFYLTKALAVRYLRKLAFLTSS